MLKRWIFWQLAVLVAVNLSIAWPLFSLDYGQYMLSNEGALVAVVRAVRNYWLGAAPDPFFWWPFWNAGMPFEHTYLPLLPLSAAAFSALTGAPPALSLHALAAFFYCLAPVGLFLFARAISAAPGPSFAAALAYSLISPSALLLPAIRADAGGALNPRRLQNVVFYGEGAHVASLALVPLALLFLYRSLKLGRLRDWLPAGVLMSAVALTNAFGAVALAIGVGCLLAVETKSAFGANLARVFVLSLSAYLWASPWIPPSLLASIASNSETVGGDYRPRLAGMLGVAAVVALCALLALLARRRGVAAHTGFFLLFGTALTSIPALAYAGEIFLLPQPHRYHLDMDLALCPLGAFGLAALGRRLPARARQAAVLLLVVFGASQLVRWREAARILVKPLEPAATVEHEIARLMEREFPGRRVMVAGTCMFWFNTFTDTPQLSGGHDTTAPNPLQRMAVSAVHWGNVPGLKPEGRTGAAWLEAFGAQAIVAPGPGSREHYKPFPDPRMYDGILPVLWRESGDACYRVPQRSASLAHVVPPAALASRAPANESDIAPLGPYLAALRDPEAPAASFEWRSLHEARIEANIAPGLLLSVQVNYHPGWRASANGSAARVFADHLGLLAIEPGCAGPCTVDLVFGRSPEARLMRALSLMAAAAAAWLAAARGLRRVSL